MCTPFKGSFFSSQPGTHIEYAVHHTYKRHSLPRASPAIPAYPVNQSALLFTCT